MPARGITFGGDALSFDAYDVDVNLPFFNDPSLGTRVMSPVGDGLATMNVDKGFAGQISFQYAATGDTSVRLYSGLDGTGDLLSTINLDQNIAEGACTTSALCLWNLVTLDFGRRGSLGDVRRRRGNGRVRQRPGQRGAAAGRRLAVDVRSGWCRRLVAPQARCSRGLIRDRDAKRQRLSPEDSR